MSAPPTSHARVYIMFPTTRLPRYFLDRAKVFFKFVSYHDCHVNLLCRAGRGSKAFGGWTKFYILLKHASCEARVPFSIVVFAESEFGHLVESTYFSLVKRVV